MYVNDNCSLNNYPSSLSQREMGYKYTPALNISITNRGFLFIYVNDNCSLNNYPSSLSQREVGYKYTPALKYISIPNRGVL